MKKVVHIIDNEDEVEACIVIAMKDFEDNLVTKYEKNGGEDIIWVINRDISNYKQTVEIDVGTAKAISEIINNVADASEDKELQCNPAEIKQIDIITLCEICNAFAERIADIEEDDDDNLGINEEEEEE